jgi:hypothetical protein
MANVHEGGCLCGATRYQATGDPIVVTFCHCSSCRRAAGAPAVAWAMFPLDRFEITKGKPSQFASSKGVERGFCGGCGTPLMYTAEVLPGLVDLTVGSMDDPSRLPPQMHIWDNRRLDWMVLADDLPRHPELPPH